MRCSCIYLFKSHEVAAFASSEQGPARDLLCTVEYVSLATVSRAGIYVLQRGPRIPLSAYLKQTQRRSNLRLTSFVLKLLTRESRECSSVTAASILVRAMR